jgi:hypothetical protein
MSNLKPVYPDLRACHCSGGTTYTKTAVKVGFREVVRNPKDINSDAYLEDAH